MAQRGKLVAVIGDEDTVVGFMLGGIVETDISQGSHNYFIADEKTAPSKIEEVFRAFVARKDIAIILINQPLAEKIRPAMKEHIASIPAILEIPDSRVPFDHSKDIILNRARGMFDLSRF